MYHHEQINFFKPKAASYISLFWCCPLPSLNHKQDLYTIQIQTYIPRVSLDHGAYTMDKQTIFLSVM